MKQVLYKVKYCYLPHLIGENEHNTWAMTWQNQQNECAPSEDSDQPGHPPSLISLRCALNG